MDKRKAMIGGCVVLLLALVAAWFLGWLGGDPAIAKLQEIGDQMSDPNLTDAQRDQYRDQFRQQMQSMNDDQRRSFFNANRGQWESRQQAQMDGFFASSPAEQRKKLDDAIDRMKPRGNQQSGGNQGNANGGGSGGRGAGMTETQREERSKRRLDGSSPKMRAQFAEFRRLLDKRAQERGVKLNNNWGRSPGGRSV